MPNTIHLHRVLAAKPDIVYRAFLEADGLAKWLLPNGFACTVHQLDAKIGGSYRMSFRNFTTSQSRRAAMVPPHGVGTAKSPQRWRLGLERNARPWWTLRTGSVRIRAACGSIDVATYSRLNRTFAKSVTAFIRTRRIARSFWSLCSLHLRLMSFPSIAGCLG